MLLIIILYINVPRFVQSAETQVMFDNSMKNCFAFSFHSWFTDRKVADTGLELQFDKTSGQNVNNPKYFKVAHESAARFGVPNTSKQ